jgi:hypothetical protein
MARDAFATIKATPLPLGGLNRYVDMRAAPSAQGLQR